MGQWQRIRLPKWETWVWSLGREDALEKEMAAHSIILAWEIPWTEEPGRLHTVCRVANSQTGLSDWSVCARMHACTHRHTHTHTHTPPASSTTGSGWAAQPLLSLEEADKLNCIPSSFYQTRVPRPQKSQVVLMVKNPPDNEKMSEMQVPSLSRKIPWRRAWQPTPVFLPGESHGQKSRAGYCS